MAVWLGGVGARRRALALVALAFALAGCSSLRGAVTPATPSATTGPPPGASQAPGPPLATASAVEGGTGTPPDPADPAAVAAFCFARWQSFDTRTDTSLGAGVQRAAEADCFTPDFLAQLRAGASASPAGPAWEELRGQGARSSVSVLAVTPLGDTAATGRVVFLLNVRTVFTAAAVTGGASVPASGGNSASSQSVSTPTVTLLRGTTGRWQIAGADLAGRAGDAPGQ